MLAPRVTASRRSKRWVPDFIDPGYHALAAGRPGRNLDPVLVPEGLIAPLYRHGSRDADVAVIEGVMGLFDGRIDARLLTPARGSTAQVAELLGAPVVLVVDARGQSRASLRCCRAFSGFHRGVRIGAVILNRVGSVRHEQVLRQAARPSGCRCSARSRAMTNWPCRRAISAW